MAMKSFIDTSKEPPSAKVNITSLMDVLTIILIFLLTNYSDEAPEAELSESIKLPILEAKSARKPGKYTKEIKLIFAKSKIEVGDQIIPFDNFEEQGDQVIDLAVTKLIEMVKDLSPEDKKKSAIILHADKEINYDMISSLVKAASVSGITHIEFLGTFEQKE